MAMASFSDMQQQISSAMGYMHILSSSPTEPSVGVVLRSSTAHNLPMPSTEQASVKARAMSPISALHVSASFEEYVHLVAPLESTFEAATGTQLPVAATERARHAVDAMLPAHSTQGRGPTHGRSTDPPYDYHHQCFHAWAVHARRCSRAKQASRDWTQGKALQLLRQWAATAAQRRRCDALYHSIMHWRRRDLMLRVFEGLGQAVLLRACDGARERGVQRRAFQAWKRTTAANAMGRKIVLARAWACFGVSVAASAAAADERLGALQLQAEAAIRTLRLRRACTTWQRRTARRQRSRSALAKSAQRSLVLRLHFSEWAHTAVASLRMADTPGAEEFCAKIAGGIKGLVLRQWLQLAKAVHFHRRHKLAWAFRGWSLHRRCARMSYSREAEPSSAHQLPQLIQLWHAKSKASARLRLLTLAVSVGPGRRLQQRRALRAWRKLAHHATATQTIQSATKARTQRQMLHAWHKAWTLHVRGEHALLSLHRRRLETALGAWWAHTRKGKQLKHAQAAVIHSVAERSASASLAAWREAALLQGRTRAAAHSLARVRVRKALQCWKRNTTQRRRMHQVYDALAMRTRARLASAALRGWRQLLRADMAARVVIGALQQRRAVAQWRAYTTNRCAQRAREECRAAAMSRARGKSAVLKWKAECVSRVQRRRISSTAHSQSLRRRLAACILHWRGVARLTWALQRPAQLHAVGTAKRSAVARWHAAARNSTKNRERNQIVTERLQIIKLHRAVALWRKGAAGRIAIREATSRVAAASLRHAARRSIQYWAAKAATAAQQRQALQFFRSQHGRGAAVNPALSLSFAASAADSAMSETTHTGAVDRRQAELMRGAVQLLANRCQRGSHGDVAPPYGGYESEGTVYFEDDTVSDIKHMIAHPSNACSETLSCSMLRSIQPGPVQQSHWASQAPPPKRCVGLLPKAFTLWRSAARRSRAARSACIAITAARLLRALRRCGLTWRLALRRRQAARRALYALWAGTVGAPLRMQRSTQPDIAAIRTRAQVLAAKCAKRRLRGAFAGLQAAAAARRGAQRTHMQSLFRVCTELKQERRARAIAVQVAMRPALRRAVRVWAVESARQGALRDVRDAGQEYGWASPSPQKAAAASASASAASSPRTGAEEAARQWAHRSADVLSPAAWLTPPPRPAGDVRVQQVQAHTPASSTPTVESWLPSWEDAASFSPAAALPEGGTAASGGGNAADLAHTPAHHHTSLSFDLSPSPVAAKHASTSPPLLPALAAARSLWLGGSQATSAETSAPTGWSLPLPVAPKAAVNVSSLPQASPSLLLAKPGGGSPQGLLKAWLAATTAVDKHEASIFNGPN